MWISLDDADAATGVVGLGGSTPAWSGIDADGHPATLVVAAAGTHRLHLRWREDGVAVHQIAIAGFEPWRPEGAQVADGRSGLGTADLTLITVVDGPVGGIVPAVGAAGGISWRVATSPGHGTVELAADGSFTYTPSPGWTGEDSFAIAIGDGATEVASDVLVVVVPAIAVAPASATLWPASAGSAVSWTGAQRLYALDVAEAGRYTIWLGGHASLPWNVVQMQLDGADIARVALYDWGIPSWWNCQDATWVQTIALPAGRHLLSLDGIDAGTSLDSLMLVPATPVAAAHDAPIPVRSAAATVIDAADYDDAHSAIGFAWQPGATGGMQAVGDIGWGADGTAAAAQDLIYDVDVPAAGTYRVWILGEGGYAADSVYLSVDGADSAQQITGFAGATPTWGSFCYDGSTPAVSILAPGSHRLHLRMCEDGTTVHQILLTQDLEWTPPAGALPATPRAPEGGDG